MKSLKNGLRITGSLQQILAVDRSVRVSLDFEEGKSFGPGALESRAQSVRMAALQSPFTAASCPFFEAEKAADWFSGMSQFSVNGSGDSSPSTKMRRLRAIKLGPDILLENSYAKDGRLASVRYFDGETVFYHWDDVGRVLCVRSQSGHEVEMKLRGDDLPASILYNKTDRFQYEYDTVGNLTQICYPDGIRIARSFGSRGELALVTGGPLDVKLRWDESFGLEGFAIVHDENVFEFSSKARLVKCDVGSASLGRDFSIYRIHPLGAWLMNDDLTLREMLTPWGERLRVAAFGRSGPEDVWSSGGLQHFDYTPAGRFIATTHPDGSRSALYTLPGQNRALLVNPRSVTLLTFDEAGRLRKSMAGNGRYSLIDYTREGRIKSVATFAETFSVFRNRQGLISEIHSDCGCACRLVYSDDGALTGFVTEAGRVNSGENVCRMLAFLWKCLGLRTIHSLVTA